MNNVDAIPFENEESTSHQRSEDCGTILRPRGRFHWDVALTDSETEHRVVLFRDRGELRGTCDCPGNRYQDDACAHLWAVRKAAQHGTTSIDELEAAIESGPSCPLCGQTPEAEVL